MSFQPDLGPASRQRVVEARRMVVLLEGDCRSQVWVAEEVVAWLEGRGAVS